MLISFLVVSLATAIGLGVPALSPLLASTTAVDDS
jgi:hypothetical protein